MLRSTFDSLFPLSFRRILRPSLANCHSTFIPFSIWFGNLCRGENLAIRPFQDASFTPDSITTHLFVVFIAMNIGPSTFANSPLSQIPDWRFKKVHERPTLLQGSPLIPTGLISTTASHGAIEDEPGMRRVAPLDPYVPTKGGTFLSAQAVCMHSTRSGLVVKISITLANIWSEMAWQSALQRRYTAISGRRMHRIYNLQVDMTNMAVFRGRGIVYMLFDSGLIDTFSLVECLPPCFWLAILMTIKYL